MLHNSSLLLQNAEKIGVFSHRFSQSVSRHCYWTWSAVSLHFNIFIKTSSLIQSIHRLLLLGQLHYNSDLLPWRGKMWLILINLCSCDWMMRANTNLPLLAHVWWGLQMLYCCLRVEKNCIQPFFFSSRAIGIIVFFSSVWCLCPVSVRPLPCGFFRCCVRTVQWN